MNRYIVCMEHETFVEGWIIDARGNADAIRRWWEARPWDETGQDAIDNSDEIMLSVHLARPIDSPPAGETRWVRSGTWYCLVSVCDGKCRLLGVS